MEWGLEPGTDSQPPPSRAGPVLPWPSPQTEGQPRPPAGPSLRPSVGTRSHRLFPSEPPPHSASQGRTQPCINLICQQEGGPALHCRKASPPSGVGDRQRRINPGASLESSLCFPGGSGSSGSPSHSPHQSPRTPAADAEAAGRRAVGESISLPLIYRGPGPLTIKPSGISHLFVMCPQSEC